MVLLYNQCLGTVQYTNKAPVQSYKRVAHSVVHKLQDDVICLCPQLTLTQSLDLNSFMDVLLIETFPLRFSRCYYSASNLIQHHVSGW